MVAAVPASVAATAAEQLVVAATAALEYFLPAAVANEQGQGCDCWVLSVEPSAYVRRDLGGGQEQASPATALKDRNKS